MTFTLYVYNGGNSKWFAQLSADRLIDLITLQQKSLIGNQNGKDAFSFQEAFLVAIVGLHLKQGHCVVHLTQDVFLEIEL